MTKGSKPTISCEWCGTATVMTTPKQRFCSDGCQRSAATERAERKRRTAIASRPPVECAHCRTPFPDFNGATYCSAKCRQRGTYLARRAKLKPVPAEHRRCKECGKKYVVKMVRQEMCSKKCRRTHMNRERRKHSTDPQPRPCSLCGESFTPDLDWTRFCSELCRSRDWHQKQAKKPRHHDNCLMCGASLDGMRSYAKWCSKRCSSKAERVNNPEGVRRRFQTPKQRVAHSIRNRTRNIVINKGGVKPDTTSRLVGCSWDELVVHLEAQFVEGMTWENYGKWHIDHIRPLASFDLTDPGQVREASHYSNLQPLWARENMVKNRFTDWER